MTIARRSLLMASRDSMIQSTTSSLSLILPASLIHSPMMVTTRSHITEQSQIVRQSNRNNICIEFLSNALQLLNRIVRKVSCSGNTVHIPRTPTAPYLSNLLLSTAGNYYQAHASIRTASTPAIINRSSLRYMRTFSHTLQAAYLCFYRTFDPT